MNNTSTPAGLDAAKDTTKESDRLALDAAQLAARLGVSVRHVSALNSSGRLPRPIKLGRSIRWSVDEIRRWLAAGAPCRAEWESIRKGPGK